MDGQKERPSSSHVFECYIMVHGGRPITVQEGRPSASPLEPFLGLIWTSNNGLRRKSKNGP